jgi:mRNA-degrading endonuclease RelE of RelBE toxin-antitoxin system
MFEVVLDTEAEEQFNLLDKTQKERFGKKISKLQELIKTRHLKHGLPFFVVEVGQYRICFEQQQNLRKIRFVGTHKQYEDWYKEFF